MNIWLGIFTLIYIVLTALIIYLKHKRVRAVFLNGILSVVAGISLFIGRGVSQIWAILLCSAVIGACLLIATVHVYNKLFTSGTRYDPVGANRKPKPFGNGYWE